MTSVHAAHTVHSTHTGWSRDFTPSAVITPGETLDFTILDASGGQLSRASGVSDVTRLDFATVNPLTGPVYIEGAQPGDALAVELLDFRPSGWGWTAIIPGFGLLADQFSEAHLIISEYDARTANFGGLARIPVRPFTGEIGVAPAEAGLHSAVPPRRTGGNLDIRDACQGATLLLPVEVAGALFSVGDTHAAQGDGEVCGTAIESPINLTLRFSLRKQANLTYPRLFTPQPSDRDRDRLGFDCTTGVGPDLHAAARDATLAMIDHLTHEYALTPQDAYCLASVTMDLKISEIVDEPNWVVTAAFPKAVME